MRFASDNAGPVHPKVMAALNAANDGWTMPYGDDEWTRRAADKVREVFEAPEAAVYFVATGTAANALALATLTQPFDAIFCADIAHTYVDECNAPEFYTGGAKLIPVPAENGKLTAEALTSAIHGLIPGNVHEPQPGALALTQLTERGTLYSLDELAKLAGLAKSADLPVFMDGARFANAAAALGASPAEMSWKAGIDAVSFGGTKNGLMGVEAAVFFDPKPAWEFELRRKRGAHLFSKSRFLAAQIDAYLIDGLWLEMATSANAAAAELTQALKSSPNVTLMHEPEGNMLFPRFPRAAHRRLHDAGAMYYLWDGTLDGDPDEMVGARLVCDWSCRAEDIDRFVGLIRG